MSVKVLLGLAVVVAGVRGYTETHCKDSKQAIVHLFEWSWDAVADECTKVLGPKGFCGVQVSPPNEHIQVQPSLDMREPVILQQSCSCREDSGGPDTSRSPTSWTPPGPATGSSSSTWSTPVTGWG